MSAFRPIAAAIAVLAIAACTSSTPGWTYAPAPSATPIPSAVASADASASVAPSASADPSASSAPSVEPTSSVGPSSVPSGEPAPSIEPGGSTVQLAAQGIAWSTTELTAPADTAFQIVFANNDASVPHDVDIRSGDPAGALVHDSDTFPGVETRTLDIDPLPAGIYAYVCSIHSNMVGTLYAE